ncbi:MAG: fatty acid desaturase [Myxococcota bacterium]
MSKAAMDMVSLKASADETRVWKANSGELAWPTIALSLVAFAVHMGALVAHAFGQLSSASLALVSALAAYVAFTPMHEAAHGNVAGRSGRPWLDTLIGMLSGVQLLAPYGAFKALHLRHHSQTNHHERDPDMWVAARGHTPFGRALSVFFRCATILPHYYFNFLAGDVSRTRGGQEARRGVLITFAVFAAMIITAVVAGFGSTVLYGWIVPAFIATAVLAFLFDWLPHAPHDVRGRYRDTRAIDAPLGIPFLGQHLHLVHHLYPRVPFYRYRRVFDALRATLKAKGAPIVKLGERPPASVPSPAE